ncbi:MAG: AtpZ/AtpI family protein [Candidatus Margulisiibacteriota bacterium]
MPKKLKIGRELGESLTLGIELVSPTLICAFLGYLADKHFGTFPFVMIAGVFLGAAGGFWNVTKRHLT